MSGNLLSPIDERYERYTADLRPYLSEAAFFKYRILVEVTYLEALIRLPLPPLKSFPESLIPRLHKAYEDFTEEDFRRLRLLEAETRHDVKAIEYFLREKWESILPEEHKYVLAFIHFGLTSQDVNTPAQALMWREALSKVYLPALEVLLRKLHQLAYAYREVPMLGFTHGQPASPTTFGKELYVFVARAESRKRTATCYSFLDKDGWSRRQSECPSVSLSGDCLARVF
jgi:adenylosuccinate lyase